MSSKAATTSTPGVKRTSRHLTSIRPDGRTKDVGVLRPLGCEMSCLSNCDGSALWKCGSTHILAGIYGPIAPQNQSKENGSQAIVSIVIKSGATGGGSGVGAGHDASSSSAFESHYEMCDFLHRILSCCIDVERYPRCVIEIVLHIVQSDGSLLGGLLHAAVAALMDAGVDLLYLPMATTCLVIRSSQSSDITNDNGQENGASSTRIRLDPTLEEEEEDVNSSIIVLVTRQPEYDLEHKTSAGGDGKGSATSDSVPSIIGSHTVGPGVRLVDLLSCMNIAMKAGPAIVAFWRLAVEQKVTRESQTLWSK